MATNNPVNVMIIKIIELLFQVFYVMLFIRIIGSWIPEFQNYRWMLFVRFYTDPYLNLFKKVIPPIGMIDISPIFAFLALGFIETFIKHLIMSIIR